MLSSFEGAGSSEPVSRPIRKSAQRFRWFFQSFEDEVTRVSAEKGLAFAINQSALAEAFAEWLRLFHAQKPNAAEDKPAYVGFAAGLMLQTLIVKSPLQVMATPHQAPEQTNSDEPAYYWPEGYAYVAYCLKVRGMVIEQDFHGRQCTNALVGDRRTWRSFKENVEQDQSAAIAFLDLFASEEPNWTTPDLFRRRYMIDPQGARKARMLGYPMA